MRETFKVGKEESVNFKYLGLEMQHYSGSIYLDQSEYFENLDLIQLDPKRHKETDESLTDVEKDTLRSRIGQLLWLSNQTRPDISFDVCVLATRLKEATVKDILEANKIVRKVTSHSIKLCYQNLGPSECLKFVTFTDAAYANLIDGGSQEAYFIFLVRENGTCNLISWQSQRIKRIVKSTLAAETLAFGEGCNSVCFIFVYRNLLWYC